MTQEAAWRIHVLVLHELPKTRETVLLRVLAGDRVRREAIAELLALPDDAWEKKVALPWLQRLNFEVPREPAGLSDEEKALMTEIQEWFEQYQQKVRGEGLDEGEKRGEKRGRTRTFARHFERRLGRPLAEGERKALAERLDRLGEDRVDDALFGLPSEALAAWLADPAAS